MRVSTTFIGSTNLSGSSLSCCQNTILNCGFKIHARGFKQINVWSRLKVETSFELSHVPHLIEIIFVLLLNEFGFRLFNDSLSMIMSAIVFLFLLKTVNIIVLANNGMVRSLIDCK